MLRDIKKFPDRMLFLVEYNKKRYIIGKREYTTIPGLLKSYDMETILKRISFLREV